MLEGVLIDCYWEFFSILEYFWVNVIIWEVFKFRVDLFLGGYIIIELMEVLMVIDVNFGFFIYLVNFWEMVFWINYEVVMEIVC